MSKTEPILSAFVANFKTESISLPARFQIGCKIIGQKNKKKKKEKGSKHFATCFWLAFQKRMQAVRRRTTKDPGCKIPIFERESDSKTSVRFVVTTLQRGQKDVLQEVTDQSSLPRKEKKSKRRRKKTGFREFRFFLKVWRQHQQRSLWRVGHCSLGCLMWRWKVNRSVQDLSTSKGHRRQECLWDFLQHLEKV